MTTIEPRLDFLAALPRRDGELTVPGLKEPITIHRDGYGVAHIRAANEHDAWFGQGYAAAQDRLWQMEMDRRRATGRWAEVAGEEARFAGYDALAADVLARRLRLGDAAKPDIEAMSPGTRAMFEAYAAGVNAFLGAGEPLPIEYGLTGATPEPWEPWHSIAVFKVRHVLMGQWQQKVVNAQVVARIGPEAFAKLDARSPLGSSLIIPPGGKVATLLETAAADIEAAAASLGFLSEIEAGSNSWAVHGSRTTTGKPVLCNDSHRALDVPNAYWQVHLSCPQFNVVGATFAGLPGFPHFGNNGSVAWNITHTSADYQDLYVEEFDPADPTRYRTPGGWAEAGHRTETIHVRGADPVVIETWATRHGPVVHGDPRSGHALALRYTATDQPCRGFEALRPMLIAATVEELFEAQRPWVDPVNNLVAADTAGNIGYLTRGRIPTRDTTAGRLLPVPGWTDEHEWTGDVPFERLPRAVNPPEGYIATANQRVIDGDDPYISATFAVPSRADRLVELLHGTGMLSPAEIAAMQGDTTSTYAKAWVRLLRRQRPFEGDAEKARAILSGWDGNLLPGSNAALLYAFFRRRVARALFEPILGRETYDWLVSESSPPLSRAVSQWLAEVVAGLDTAYATHDQHGRPWTDVLPGVLTEAWHLAVESGGPDPAAWRWDAKHGTRPRHALGFAFPELAEQLDPPRAMVGGDSDTLQCATYGASGRNDFNITALSVYRQVVDFARPDHGSFVVPTGASGQPGTPHYGDQAEHWRKHERIAAWLNDDDVLAASEHELTLHPA